MSFLPYIIQHYILLEFDWIPANTIILWFIPWWPPVSWSIKINYAIESNQFCLQPGELYPPKWSRMYPTEGRNQSTEDVFNATITSSKSHEKDIPFVDNTLHIKCSYWHIRDFNFRRPTCRKYIYRSKKSNPKCFENSSTIDRLELLKEVVVRNSALVIF